MKMPISKFRSISAAAFAAVSLLFFACSTETPIGDAPHYPGDGTTFVVSAAAQSHAATRAIDEGSAFDTMVEDITVLLFDAGTKKYVRYVRRYLSAGDFQPLPGGAGGEKRLKFTAGIPNGNYIALFVANAAEMIDFKYNLAAGTVTQGGGDMKALEIGDVEAALVREFGGKYDADPASAKYTPFVMSSGREALTLPLASAKHYIDNPVRLARDVAKINVRFISQGAAARLKISEIRLCNYNTRSFAVGTADLWNMWNNAKENGNKTGITNALYAPGVSRPAGKVIGGYGAAIVYDNSDPKHQEIDANGRCVDEIFTAEQPFAAKGNEKDNLCLLVGGQVNIDGTDYGTRWYKLALIRKDSLGVQHYVNVLRNYVYTLNITSVTDPGYESPERAYNEHPGNLSVDLEVVDEEGLENVVYNGHYYLAVTKDLYEFSCLSELAQELRIHTDYPDGWKISPAPEEWPDWLKEEWQWGAGASGSKGVTVADKLWASVNPIDKQRQFVFTVTAGPLSQRIVVRQKPNVYIFATPGMVGIRSSDYRGLLRARAEKNDPAWLDPAINLTLKGSGTYAGTIVDKPQVTAEFGGLESEPVYSVYMMFGSTVALVMGNGDKWESDGRRVVWTNPGFRGSTVGPWMSSSTFVHAAVKTTATGSNPDVTYNIVDDPAKGHGDICRAISNGVYRTPAGGPWRLADGTAPFGTVNIEDQVGKWWEKPESPAKFWLRSGAGVPHVGIWNSSLLADNNETIFLPSAGAVTTTDSGVTGIMGMLGFVQYRTSTASSTAGGIMDYELFAANFALSPNILGYLNIGLPVRCVKAAAPPVQPVQPAPPAQSARPVLNPVENAIPATIPQAGGTYPITVETNLPTWGIRAYLVGADNNRVAAGDLKNIAGSPDKTNAIAKRDVKIGANSGNQTRALDFLVYNGDQTRTLEFFIYSDDYPDAGEISVGVRSQAGATPRPTISVKRTYGWGQYKNEAGYIMQSGAGARKIVDAPVNFGTDAGSAVKIERFSRASTFDHTLLTGGDAYNPAKIKEMFGKKPDIVLTGFDIDVPVDRQAEVAGYMMDYLKAGGTLILALEHPGLSKALFEAMFPGSAISINWRTDNTFLIEDVGDDITDGPFGKIGGKYRGNDGNGTRSIAGMPEDDLVVYSRDAQGNPTMFRHKVYNMMFIGDGGAFANYNGTPGVNGGTTAGTLTFPLAFDTDGRPITRTGWIGANGGVENSRLFANIMAWAARQADTNGINKK